MLANQRTFGIFKENAENLAPGKSSVSKSQRGLKSRNLNSISDSTSISHKAKSESGLKAEKSNLSSGEKENAKPKVLPPKVKTEIQKEQHDSWSDIEEMHIHIEPDDDYEDILPMCERIQKADLDSLFVNYTCNFTELSVDKIPSPLKEYKISGVFEYSPTIPENEAALFDDTELDLVPLPMDFPIFE